MIGPRHLLTVSHIVDWTAPAGFAADWVRFKPSCFDGDGPFGIAYGEHIYWYLREDGDGFITGDEGDYDYHAQPGCTGPQRPLHLRRNDSMDTEQRVRIANQEVIAYREWLRRETQDQATPRVMSATAGRRQQVTVVAEGDSWFNYIIGKDVVWWLRRRFGHEIHEVAYPGATLNDMAYGPDTAEVGDLDISNITQLAETLFLIETHRPRIILLSGGGNDIAGPEFIQALKHAEAPVSGANLKVVEGLLDSYEEAYQVILTAIEEKLDALGLSCHIILHGYDFPFPNGKGIGLGPVNFVGPWFNEPFSMRGYSLDRINWRRTILKQILGMFNARLETIARQRPQRVRFLNLQDTLTKEEQWANELHPTNAGFRLIAEKFDALIQDLVGQDA